jgi:hypothetical protein
VGNAASRGGHAELTSLTNYFSRTSQINGTYETKRTLIDKETKFAYKIIKRCST